MFRFILILPVFVLILGFTVGCGEEHSPGPLEITELPPDFTGTILAVHQPRANSLLLSVKTSTFYSTDEIVIHTPGLVDHHQLEAGVQIRVWIGRDKMVMESNPPQANADCIEIVKR